MRWYSCALALTLLPIYGCDLVLGICLVAIPKPPHRSATKAFDESTWRRRRPVGYHNILKTRDRHEMSGNALSIMTWGLEREVIEEKLGAPDHEFELAAGDGIIPLFPDMARTLHLVDRRSSGKRTVETWLGAEYDSDDKLRRSYLLRWVRTPYGEIKR